MYRFIAVVLLIPCAIIVGFLPVWLALIFGVINGSILFHAFKD